MLFQTSCLLQAMIRVSSSAQLLDVDWDEENLSAAFSCRRLQILISRNLLLGGGGCSGGDTVAAAGCSVRHGGSDFTWNHTSKHNLLVISK